MSQIPPVPPEGDPPPGGPQPPPPPAPPPPPQPPQPPGWGQAPPTAGQPQAPLGSQPGAPGQPPGFGGQPPGYQFTQAPKSRGMSSGVKALLAVGVLAIVGVVAFLVLGGSDDDGSSPEEAVRSFFSAAEARDCDRLFDLVSEASWSQGGIQNKEQALAQCRTEIQQEDFFPEGATIDKVTVRSQDGDKATIDVTSTVDGDTSTDPVDLVKEDGRWKIDFSGIAGSGSPGEIDTTLPGD